MVVPYRVSCCLWCCWHWYCLFFSVLVLRVLSFLFFTLFRAQVGYLFSVNTFHRCSSSSFSSCWFEHTALAVLCKVFTTLYLAAIVWWLSHCRYKSVWVGFLYTFVLKLPSELGVTRVSKKGMDPSLLLSSMGN